VVSSFRIDFTWSDPFGMALAGCPTCLVQIMTFDCLIFISFFCFFCSFWVVSGPFRVILCHFASIYRHLPRLRLCRYSLGDGDCEIKMLI